MLGSKHGLTMAIERNRQANPLILNFSPKGAKGSALGRRERKTLKSALFFDLFYRAHSMLSIQRSVGGFEKIN